MCLYCHSLFSPLSLSLLAPFLFLYPQSVNSIHPRAADYLYRDCHNVTRFFKEKGVEEALAAGALFTRICGKSISAEQEVEFLQKVSMAKGKLVDESQETSAVCEHMPWVSRANKELLVEGLESKVELDDLDYDEVAGALDQEQSEEDEASEEDECKEGCEYETEMGEEDNDEDWTLVDRS